MNVRLSEKIFDQLVEATEDLAKELNEAAKHCNQFDASALENRIAELERLVIFCQRAKKAASHGREIKNQVEDITLPEAMDFLSGAGMQVYTVDEEGIHEKRTNDKH